MYSILYYTFSYTIFIYVVISVILLAINNVDFDVQCGSSEYVPLKTLLLFFSYLYI